MATWEYLKSEAILILIKSRDLNNLLICVKPVGQVYFGPIALYDVIITSQSHPKFVFARGLTDLNDVVY